jgi:hypothetical protein
VTGSESRKAAQKSHLVGGMGAATAQYEGQIVIAVGHRPHLRCRQSIDMILDI